VRKLRTERNERNAIWVKKRKRKRNVESICLIGDSLLPSLPLHCAVRSADGACLVGGIVLLLYYLYLFIYLKHY